MRGGRVYDGRGNPVPGAMSQELKALLDERARRLGAASPAPAKEGRGDTEPDAPAQGGAPVAEAEDARAQEAREREELEWMRRGVVREGDTPFKKGLETFLGSFWGRGRLDAMDEYRTATRGGGRAGAVLGYLSDLGNAFWEGLLGGGAKIAEAAGRVVGSDGLVEGARGAQEVLRRHLPTDMTDTAPEAGEDGRPAARSWGARVAEEGKNVMRMAGEFAPAAVPGAGGAYYANALVGAGAANTGFGVYEAAVANAERSGLTKGQAAALGVAAGAIDGFANAFLMGKFKGRAPRPADARFFQSFIKRQLAGAAKAAGVMGANAGAQTALTGLAEGGGLDVEATGNAAVDAAIQGAMFHVLNEGLHAPVRWSALRARRRAEAEARDRAEAEADKAATEARIGRERDEFNGRRAEEARAEEALRRRVEAARAVLGDPQGMAKFAQQNPELALDLMAARRRNEDVDLARLRDTGVNGVGELAAAFQTQGDANAFADRLLLYMDDARAAERQREAKARGDAVERGERPPDLESMAEDFRKDALAQYERDVAEREAEAEAPAPAPRGGEAAPGAPQGGEIRPQGRAAPEPPTDARAGGGAPGGAEVAAEARAAREAHRAASMRGMEERARRRAEAEEYERKEAERSARERAEEEAAPTVAEEEAAREAAMAASRRAVEEAAARGQSDLPAPRGRQEYRDWLAQGGRRDTDKNWNRFVAESGLDPSLRVDRGRNAAPKDGGAGKADAAEADAASAEAPPGAGKADAYAAFLRARIARLKDFRTSADYDAATRVTPEETAARRALAEDGEAAADFARRHGALLGEHRAAIHEAAEREHAVREAEIEAGRSSPEARARALDDAVRAFGAFDDGGRRRTIREMVDDGWRVEKSGGAVKRWRLVKGGAGYDLSSKRVKERFGTDEAHREAVRRVAEYMDARAAEAARAGAPKAAETPPAPKAEAPAPRAEPPPAPSRADTRRAVIDEGRRSVMASPNAKSHGTGRDGAEKVVYAPKDGGRPFTVGRNAFEHSLRGANAEDNAIVGRHLGEALDASSPVGERSANATFRIAPVKVRGEDAHVLFTVVDGEMTEFDVLKGYNTKKNPEGMMSEVGGADAAKAFEVRADSIADLDRAWQERFKPGLVEHARRKGQALAFSATERASGAEAQTPPAPKAGTPTAPVSKTETTAAKAEAPAAKPRPARAAWPKREAQGGEAPLKDAVERLRRARADKDAAPEAVAEADAAVEAARAPDRPFGPPRPRPNARAAAKVVGEFVGKDGTREALLEPYHDKESGMVVATDGRILIATRHGLDPSAPGREYPKWQQVVPPDKDLTRRAAVNPSALAKACAEAVRLARATGAKLSDGKGRPAVVLRFGDMEAYYDAEHLGKFARAMEANGITEVRAGDNPNFGPLVARNGETTVLQMPLRRDAEPRAGRHADNGRIVVSGESGRVVSAPERTDVGPLGREGADAARADAAKTRARALDRMKATSTYDAVMRARQRGETDAAKAYGEGWERLNDKSREAFEKALRAKTDAEADDVLADYVASVAPHAYDVRSDEARVAKAEKRIAAEDALEALVMRRADAEAYLGRRAGAKRGARFSRRPEEDGGAEADAETVRVNPRLAEDVRTAIAGDADGKPVGRRREVAFSEMPGALKAVGIPDLPIRTRTDIVRKIHRDHGFTEQQIVALPEAYGRPAAVFSDGKAYVVLTGMQVATRGGSEKPVMVVLRESVGRDGRHEFLASAYPREEANENFYEGLARNGKMLFLDKNKVAVSGLNGRTISTLNEQADGNRVKAATLDLTGEERSSFESVKDSDDAGSMPHSAGGVKGASRPSAGGGAEAAREAEVRAVAERLARLVPGARVRFGELPEDARRAGAVAMFDRRTGEATVAPGASLADAVHELGGHAVRLWAERSSPELLRRTLEYVRAAPKEVKEFVFRNYGDFAPDALVDEIFAQRFAREHADGFRRLLAEGTGPRRWWTNVANAVRGVFSRAARENGVDLARLRGLGAEEYVAGVAEQLAAGRALGGRGGAEAAGDGGARYAVARAATEGVRDALRRIADGEGRGVVHNAEYGDIEYPLGRMGRRGMGLAHIVESRMAKDGATLDEALDVAIKVASAAEGGRTTAERYNTKHLDKDGVRAIVAFMPDGSRVITGYEISADGPGGANRRSPGPDSRPHVSLEGIVAALKDKLSSSPRIVPHPGPSAQGGEARFSVGRLYTGSAADYESPSLVHVGTGEGSQVYGWGLYASDRRGIAESYAREGAESKRREADARPTYFWIDGKPVSENEIARTEGIDTVDALYRVGDGVDKAKVADAYDSYAKGYQKNQDPPNAEGCRRAARFLRDHEIVFEKQSAPTENVYEQTFFTDRAPGDESHLLKWYEPVSEEQLTGIGDGASRLAVRKLPSGALNVGFERDGRFTPIGVEFANGLTGGKLYGMVARSLGSPKAASEFLARAGIDGVKYPADSYGGKGVKDGDEAGWNYVSFRDDNIRVDHKWTDGQMRFSVAPDGLSEKERRDRLALKDNPGDAIAEARGHDGLILRNVRDGAGVGEMDRPATDYVVFGSRQVKSAGDNAGAFDPANPDVRFSVARAENDAWRRVVDEYVEGRLAKRQDATVLPRVPAVISRVLRDGLGVSAEGRRVVISSDCLAKAMDGKHRIPPDEMKRLATSLDAPLAVFQSRTRPDDSVTALVPIRDRNGGVSSVVPIDYTAKSDDGGDALRITSVYGKTSAEAVQSWIDQGYLLYADRKNISRSFPHRLQLPGRNKTAKRFLDETDFSREALGMVSNPGGNGNGETPPAPDGGVRFSRPRHPLDDALPERLRYMDRERGARERAAFEYARNMADRYAPVREAVRDALAAHGADAKEADRAALASAASPYHAKRVQGGHAERDMARARAIEADLAGDVAALGRLGLSVDDLGVWAYASHAKARNAQKRREGGAENGSGISDALADDILSGRGFSLGDGAERRYSPEQARALEAARRRVVGRLNGEFGLDYLHRAGLVDEATRGRLERAYGKDWVSLADDISEDGVDYNAAATVANPLKRARGRNVKLLLHPLFRAAPCVKPPTEGQYIYLPNLYYNLGNFCSSCTSRRRVKASLRPRAA